MARCRVAIDATGGDDGCQPAVRAAIDLADRCDVLLVGPAAELMASSDEVLPEAITICPATQTVRMDDDPVKAIRNHRDSSALVTARAVATGRADVMVTPGNTGAAVLAATVQFGRIPGVAHPALAVMLPSPLGGSPTVLIDVGAAVSCKPAWLVQFADMGTEYHRVRMGTASPTVALLSNGSEGGKGGPARAEAHRLLRDRDDYVGQVEGHDLLTTDADVILVDGFTGNVALKTYEGAARVTALALLAASVQTASVTDEDRSQWRGSLADAMYVDGGAILLGLQHLCVICHGASTARDLGSAIELAVKCWEGELPEAIVRRFERSASLVAR